MAIPILSAARIARVASSLLILAAVLVASCAKKQDQAPSREQPVHVSHDSKVTPIASVDEGTQLVDSFNGKAEDFQLVMPDSLQDASGMNMAIITDRILARSWWPNGFVQGQGYRIYRYTSVPPASATAGRGG
jgi:hypothetical protein